MFKIDVGKYGLGTRRSLDDLIKFIGIDVRTRTIFANKCTTLKWVIKIKREID